MGESGGYEHDQIGLHLIEQRFFEREIDEMLVELREAVDEIGPKIVAPDLSVDLSTLSNWLSGKRDPETHKLLRPPPACLTFYCKRRQRSQRFARWEAYKTGFLPPQRKTPNSITDENKLLKAALNLFGPDGERRRREIEDGFVIVPKPEGGAR